MLREIAALAVLGLAGCAISPQDLRERGDRSAYQLARAPQDAAGCVARNVENGNTLLGESDLTSIRPAATQSNWELVVTVPSYGYTRMVAEFAPAPPGSTATAWVPSVLMGKERFLGAFNGC